MVVVSHVTLACEALRPCQPGGPEVGRLMLACHKRGHLPRLLGERELPGDSEAVGDPAEALTERVAVEGHQDGAIL